MNVGEAGDLFTVSADTGGAPLPLAIGVCQTDPLSGQCVTPAGPSAVVQINPGETPTVAFFVSAQGVAIAFDPAAHRIFVRLRGSDGAIRGSTSVAVRTI